MGLMDRSSRPLRSPRITSAELISQVELLRRQRWTGVRIAQATGLSPCHRQSYPGSAEIE